MPASPLTHIYLSPHADDAVFSCGALIHRQVAAGSRVVVVTVAAGNPPPGPLSPFAQSLHDRWSGAAGTPAPRSPAELAALRRSEDLAALAELGSEAVHLDIPDCIYRLNPTTGWPMYASETALFGSLHTSELTLVRRIATKLTTLLHGFGRQHLYVPLGIGQHVDHALTRRAAEVGGAIFAYYEDVPYVLREAARWPDPQSPLLQDRPLTPDIVPVTEADIAAWLRASEHYVSQISSFWTGVAGLAQALRDHAYRVGNGQPAMRIWRSS